MSEESTYKKFLDQLQLYTYELKDFYAFLADQPLPEEEYEKLLVVVHKVAGLCLTFDLSEEGHIARYIETRLRESKGEPHHSDAIKALVKNLISVCHEGYESGMEKYEAQERLVRQMESTEIPSAPKLEPKVANEQSETTEIGVEAASLTVSENEKSNDYTGRELTVLFVDDDPVLRMLAERKLGNKGYNVTVAKDGVLAVKLAKVVHPDVILMDGSMPHMDGMEAAGLIKNDDEIKDIPIFLLTGFSRAEFEGYDERLIEEHIEKPFKAEELVKLFERYFPNHVHA